jgi:hypothetical protein
MTPIVLVPLTEPERAALALLPELMELLRAKRREVLTLTDACRRVKRRTGAVSDALRSGELRGKLVPGGSRGRWRIDSRDLDEWALKYKNP